MADSQEHLTTISSENDVVSLCQDIVRINTINPPGNEAELAKYCLVFLKNLGFDVQYINHSESRASVLACLKGNGKTKGVMICAHMDTVPLGESAWQHDALSGEISNGKIWGRGASDMKGGLAAILAAAKELVESGLKLNGDLWIGLTAGEEVDFLGAGELAKHNEMLPLQVLLIPEPSSNEIFLAQKGALWLEVIIEGKTAHGSMPDLGINAVEIMADFIACMKQLEFPYQPHPLLDRYTAAVTTIQGGFKVNVVPDQCSVTIDIRTVPGQNHANMLNQVRGLLNTFKKDYPGLKTWVKVMKDYPAVVTDPDDPAVLTMLKTAGIVAGHDVPIKGVRYFTDSAVLAPAYNVPVIICGPGHADLAHQPDEYVEIGLLRKAVEIYTNTVSEYLK